MINEQTVGPSIDELRATVRESDPNASPDDEGFAAALVLLALVARDDMWRPLPELDSRIPRPRALAEFTEIPEDRIERYLANLRASHVLHGGHLLINWAEGGKDSGLEFWLDVAVALGMIKRGLAEDRG